LKIAYFSPLNPIKSGVSDYSEELLEYLGGYGRIDLFIDDYKPTSSWIYEHFNVYNFRRIFENHGKNDHDVNIYHIGNNDNHSYIYSVCQQYPGVVVLHEPMLHHFVFSQTVGNNRIRDYLRELDYCYKAERSQIVKVTLEERDENAWYDYPLVDRIVDSSLGVIVHSEYARAKVLDVNPNARVKKILHHWAPQKADHERSPELIREILGFRPDEFLIGSMGYINSSKRIDVFLRVMAKAKALGYPVKLLLVGKMLSGMDVPRWIEDLGLEQDVLVAGFVDTMTFGEYLNVPDMFVALRHPSAGETSGSVIKMMGAGKPVMLSNEYAFSEFPDDCCIKIPIGPDEEDQLLERLIYYIENPDERRALGERSKAYIMKQHDIQDAARGYIEFATELLSS
jgi:glycosyltransferase involved in cell wall biosynthesis